jgi:hypothetical protein
MCYELLWPGTNPATRNLCWNDYLPSLLLCLRETSLDSKHQPEKGATSYVILSTISYGKFRECGVSTFEFQRCSKTFEALITPNP